jgi:hypothetical protein
MRRGEPDTFGKRADSHLPERLPSKIPRIRRKIRPFAPASDQTVVNHRVAVQTVPIRLKYRVIERFVIDPH